MFYNCFTDITRALIGNGPKHKKSKLPRGKSFFYVFNIGYGFVIITDFVLGGFQHV